MKKSLVLIFFVIALFLVACGQQKEQQTTTEEQQIDLSKYNNIKQLATMDVPIYCEGTTNIEGQQVNYKIWYKHGKYRGEFNFQGMTSILISTQEAMYTKYINMEGMPPYVKNCDWLKFEKTTIDEVESYEEETSTEKQYIKPEEINPIDYNCRIKSFSETIFEPEGKVCSFADMIAAAMGQQ